ncbi:uncharacterized protein LOC132294072 [Cornus florida]|uniref:uncharacterized protein LOC132294072 n=1 Tax=Cornus florida TaxID=4283 RepID=UPI00289706FF|nr:uncharacterized protein LOC132294072 [Cornus florida]
MACSLNMFNNEQQGLCTNSMGPRISFSNDFLDTQQPINHEKSYREAPVSSDFEFSAKSNAMISADELFFKGKLLPLKENCAKMTLREELLIHDDDHESDNVFPWMPKGSGRWKERLGLKRTHIVPKKADHKSFGTLETIEEVKKTMLVHEEACATNTEAN